MNYKRLASRALLNLKGWNTGKNIVVIESDDWGSIRTPDNAVLQRLDRSGSKYSSSPYNRFDALESEDDFSALFDVLSKFRDFDNRSPVITANTIVANPDFEKIEEGKFETYFYENFTETYKRYPKHKNSLKLFKEGIASRLLWPQFHGREHLNVALWMKGLQSKAPSYLEAFKNNMWRVEAHEITLNRCNLYAAFDAENDMELAGHGDIIRDGLRIFEEIFGFWSKSFIANNYIWGNNLNMALAEAGVVYFQGMGYQKHPILNLAKRPISKHYLGERNSFGQIYMIRNCEFEPSQHPDSYDSVGTCLREIQLAFLLRKPAIITSHRVNYIGFLNENNRRRSLSLLSNLIATIQKKWPKTVFLSSDELGSLILGR